MTREVKLAIIAMVLAAGAAAGCNTIKGAGQDVSAAGAGVEEAATDAQDELEKN